MFRPIRTRSGWVGASFKPTGAARRQEVILSTQSTFYQARAAEERDKATGSTLDNVRDGHRRAAAAWDALAARSLKADRIRAEEELRKSEVRSTEMAIPMMVQQEL